MMDPECLDGFFASSPLFGAHSPHGGNSSLGSLADDSSADHNFDAQLMFAHSNQLGHQQHKPELLLQSQEHTAVHSPVAPPELNLCDSFHPLTAAHAPYPPQQMLWQPAPMTVSTHVPIIEQPVHYASSRASSGSNASGHSTPTLVAASSPTPTGHKPSLLDQLSCHVPDVAAGANSVLFAPVTSKAKREKRVTIKKESKTAAAATPTTSAAAAAATAMAEKNLPTFVASSHHMHLMAPQQPQHLPLYAPLMHSSASFVSASSSSSSPSSAPSRALSTSPAVSMDDDSNNEPSPNDDDATKKLKLARKAELARLSRKRKKTRLTDLEAEVRHLEVELEKCKKSKLDAQEASHQAAMAHQAHLAADALTEQKMNAVISAMTAAVHHGMTMTPSPVVSPSVSHRAPVLTGADAPSRAGPTALTPLIDEFMAQYNESAHNCTQHLSTLQEHHIKPLRTFEFLNALMKQNEVRQPRTPACDLCLFCFWFFCFHCPHFPLFASRGPLDFVRKDFINPPCG